MTLAYFPLNDADFRRVARGVGLRSGGSPTMADTFAAMPLDLGRATWSCLIRGVWPPPDALRSMIHDPHYGIDPAAPVFTVMHVDCVCSAMAKLGQWSPAARRAAARGIDREAYITEQVEFWAAALAEEDGEGVGRALDSLAAQFECAARN